MSFSKAPVKQKTPEAVKELAYFKTDTSHISFVTFHLLYTCGRLWVPLSSLCNHHGIQSNKFLTVPHKKYLMGRGRESATYSCISPLATVFPETWASKKRVYKYGKREYRICRVDRAILANSIPNAAGSWSCEKAALGFDSPVDPFIYISAFTHPQLAACLHPNSTETITVWSPFKTIFIPFTAQLSFNQLN